VNGEANVSGKGASAEGDAEMSARGSEAEGKGEMSRAASGETPGATSTLGPSRVLLGARHDLKLRDGKGTASCQCLSVALGGSHNAGMVWSAAPPDIDESTQLTVALSSEGQACKDEPKQSLGASYWGYRLSGNDVVVLVEAARGGRPLTNGAVIPKPVGSGQVYVTPASRALPYGRPLEGRGLCKIGNPGAPRTTPFSELEVGQNAPAAGSARPGDRALSDHSANQGLEETPTTIELPSN